MLFEHGDQDAHLTNKYIVTLIVLYDFFFQI